MIRLYVQAPFAAFRPFTAGWYRPTATFFTPSAAYGLALNLAGIETRRDDGLSAMTLTQFDLPPARIALGVDANEKPASHPTVQTLYQQLHNYPVGMSGKERADDAMGNKYNITPVRREFLSDLRAIVALDFLDRLDVEHAILRNLADPQPSAARYGLPFLGDNAFLLDKIVELKEPRKALWYKRLSDDPDATPGPVDRSTRLTIWIDRKDMSRTRSAVFAPDKTPSYEIPEAAWTPIEPPTSPKPDAKPSKKKKG